jgi:hypothetical protein
VPECSPHCGARRCLPKSWLAAFERQWVALGATGATGERGERDAVLALKRLRVYDDSHLAEAAVIATQGSRAAAQLGCLLPRLPVDARGVNLAPSR